MSPTIRIWMRGRFRRLEFSQKNISKLVVGKNFRQDARQAFGA